MVEMVMHILQLLHYHIFPSFLLLFLITPNGNSSTVFLLQLPFLILSIPILFMIMHHSLLLHLLLLTTCAPIFFPINNRSCIKHKILHPSLTGSKLRTQFSPVIPYFFFTVPIDVSHHTTFAAKLSQSLIFEFSPIHSTIFTFNHMPSMKGL